MIITNDEYSFSSFRKSRAFDFSFDLKILNKSLNTLRKEMIDERRKIIRLIRTHIQIEDKRHFKLRAKNILIKDQE
jgi:hypothetical protein